MRILAINSGIGSSIGLFENGTPYLCVEEERFNRTKNWMGFPTLAFQYFQEQGLLKAVDYVALCNKRFVRINRQEFYQMYNNNFKWAKEENFNGKKRWGDFRRRLYKSAVYKMYADWRFGKKKETADTDVEVEKLLGLGFKSEQLIRVEHHQCHAAAVYYGLARQLSEPYLVLTLDGSGDGLTATVNKGEQGRIERLQSIRGHSIGNIYSIITHYLGFTPHEHEYKLMGLAPYVNQKYIEKYKSYFYKFLDLRNEDTEFFSPVESDYHLTYMRAFQEDLLGVRFDTIAGALQAFCEEIVIRWIKGCIRKYKINKILASGGVFMNVKMNMLIAELPEVAYFDVFPSCGDESNIFGAAFSVYNDKVTAKVGCLSSYTLGTKPVADRFNLLERFGDKIRIEVLEDPNQFIADALVANKIVARCSGAMEFGARALGNRSILANPSNLVNVGKINRAIKNRDFWMPFAPALLAERANEIIEIPAALAEQGSPYMMFTFRSKEEWRNAMICGLHQADYTARAEFVSKERYPDFHQIITLFAEKTGIPVVLNTSFNLHGFPIVETAVQAVEVLLASQIDVLVIENLAIYRN
jgi:carbamoyltransferase